MLQRKALFAEVLVVVLCSVTSAALATEPTSTAAGGVAPRPEDSAAPALVPAHSDSGEPSLAAQVSPEVGARAIANDPPPPRTGFQLALRTGYALPMGSADDGAGDDMSNLFSGQVPFLVDIGGKVIPAIFLGGYFGLGIGGTAGTMDTICSNPSVSCATVTVRVGAEIIGYFRPGEKVDPWLGYGIGFESSAIAISGPGGDASVAASGPEFANFMAGVDFRLNSTFGLGPFVAFSIGQYSRLRSESPNGTTTASVADKAMHEWLALGVRGVFFP